jgi:hypothetical protein
MASEATELFGEWDSESEAAEATLRSVRRPSSQPSFRPRPVPSAPQYVTQVQLETSLSRVDNKVKTVADGVTILTTRLAALSGGLKKEADERKKSGEGQNKDINQKLQMLALLPLLIQPTSKPIDASGAPTSGGTALKSVLVPDPSPIDALLPLLLVGGLGSGGMGLGGDSSGGSDNSLMLLALVLAFSNKPQS